MLRCIDKAIPFPSLFELRIDGEIMPIAAYKRLSESDSAKWVISKYFEGGWVSSDAPRKPLPMVFDLETLYEHLLMPLMPHPSRPAEGMRVWVQRMVQIHSKQSDLDKCKARLRKEKQFNRKVAINAELRALKQEIQALTSHLPVSGSAVAQ